MMETGPLLFEFLAEKSLEASELKPRARTEYADEVVSLAVGGQRLSAKLAQAIRI